MSNSDSERAIERAATVVALARAAMAARSETALEQFVRAQHGRIYGDWAICRCPGARSREWALVLHQETAGVRVYALRHRNLSKVHYRVMSAGLNVLSVDFATAREREAILNACEAAVAERGATGGMCGPR